jgi:flagellar motor protein MotB
LDKKAILVGGAATLARSVQPKKMARSNISPRAGHQEADMREWFFAVLCMSAFSLGCASTKNVKTDSANQSDRYRKEYAECQSTADKLEADNTHCNKALEEQKQRFAFMSRWQNNFGKIADSIRERLANIEVDDSGSKHDKSDIKEIVTESVEYSLSVRGGALVLTFSNDVFFPRGKPGLTAQGKRVARELVRVFQESDKRTVFILCRSVEARGAKAQARQSINRDLSSKRSVAIVAGLAAAGGNPRDFVAGAYTNFTEEDALEVGRTEFVVSPLAQELPKYPDKL